MLLARSEVLADPCHAHLLHAGRALEKLGPHLGLCLGVLAHAAHALLSQAFTPSRPNQLGELILVASAGLVAQR